MNHNYFWSDECRALPYFESVNVFEKIRLSKLRHKCTMCTHWCTAPSTMSKHIETCQKTQEPFNPRKAKGVVYLLVRTIGVHMCSRIKWTSSAI